VLPRGGKGRKESKKENRYGSWVGGGKEKKKEREKKYSEKSVKTPWW
jgi:hypothetical protein